MTPLELADEIERNLRVPDGHLVPPYPLYRTQATIVLKALRASENTAPPQAGQGLNAPHAGQTCEHCGRVMSWYSPIEPTERGEPSGVAGAAAVPEDTMPILIALGTSILPLAFPQDVPVDSRSRLKRIAALKGEPKDGE